MKVEEIVFVVEEDPEGRVTARALGYSIFTETETVEALKEKVRDAIKCHFGSNEESPKLIRLHIVKEETFAYA